MTDFEFEEDFSNFEAPAFTLPEITRREEPKLYVSDFLYDLYDWNDPEFLEKNTGPYAIYPILLTKGYFMIVSPSQYKSMTEFPDGTPKKWCASIRHDHEGNLIGGYAHRHGRKSLIEGEPDEPKTVSAHRELLGCLHAKNAVIDHVNGIGLDNRAMKDHAINLKRTTHRGNGSNAQRTRSVHTDLLPGVERCGVGNLLFQGVISRRLSKIEAQLLGKIVDTKRSRPLMWETQEPAHEWYLEELKKRNGDRTEWARVSESVNWPILPPRWDSEPKIRKSTASARLFIRDVSPIRVEAPTVFAEADGEDESCPF